MTTTTHLMRLRELAASHRLDRTATECLARLLDHLAEDPYAPTPVRDRALAVETHIADSLTALDLPLVRQARELADLGSGAGYPALALAAALPNTRVHAVESVGRKASFIASAVAASGLRNVDVVTARAEEWRPPTGGCDVVTARALASLAVIAEYAAPLLRMGGALVAWKGRRDEDEERAGRAAAVELGLQVGEPIRVEPFPDAEDRHLHVWTKVAPTPRRFPRRPGMARKRPLGS